ncbi:MAG: translation initiation factor IF-2 [bacterium]
MARKRVYQAARELSLSSEALLGILKTMGIKVKSHMSAIDDETVDALKDKLKQEKEAVKKEAARKKKMREAAKAKPKAKPAKKPAPPPKRPVVRRRVSDEKSVKDTVRKTLAEMDGAKKPRRRRRKSREETESVDVDRKLISVTEFISVGELANVMQVSSAKVVACCMRLGLMATVNQRLDGDAIETIADEFGYEVEFEKEYGAQLLEEAEAEEQIEALPRHPVVTIMGHVDHGKTSLLDYIRRSNIVGGESGSITQHIGAYEVESPAGKITFLDTPGHEAFTAMRARGAQATDIVILVVAANESVMPQTIEAIDHAKAAEVPIIVAINKIDLPDANLDRVKQELGANSLTPEDWGGKTITVPVSAKTGEGVDHLLEMVILQAEMLEITAPREGRGSGVVIESRVEQGRGIVVTVLIQKGRLVVGDPFAAGIWSGKVRALFDDRGRNVAEGFPGMPLEVLGSQGVPQAGDSFMVTHDEKEARDIAAKRQILQREREHRAIKHISLEDLYSRISAGEVRELRIIAKADVDGSVEALSDVLSGLRAEEVGINIIHKAVGPINETDVLLASASDAVIIGFHVGVLPKARDLAKRENVDVRTYDVIYEVTKDIQAAMKGLLAPKIEEKVIGTVEVRQVFMVRRTPSIAGCFVTGGSITRNALVRVMRGEEVVFDGKIASLRRVKDDVKEVLQGYECGLVLEGFADFKEGDLVEAYLLEEVERA